MDYRFGKNNRSNFSAAILALLFIALPSVSARPLAPNPAQKPEAMLSHEIEHQLLMLPYYTVFDNLEYQIQSDGTVVLSGQVVRPTLKTDAANVVKDIPGVKNVVNNIQVLPLSPFDASLRLELFHAIYSRTGLEKYRIMAVPPIHIIVDNGHVTLVGVVDTKTDKEIAGIAARGVPGTFSVTNNLKVEDRSKK